MAHKTPEEIAAYRREWSRMDYQRNPEKYRAKARKWREANLEKARAMSRDYQRRNQDAARKRYAAWLAKPENRQKMNAALASRLREHPELRQKYEAVRRARKRGVATEMVDRRVVLANYQGLCGWCGDPVGADFHVDHIIALVHGGEHSYANTQPVHPACNYEKRTVLKERAGMNRLLRVREAEVILAIGHTRIYELIAAGELRTVRIGERGVRVPESEIDRFIKERLDAA